MGLPQRTSLRHADATCDSVVHGIFILLSMMHRTSSCVRPEELIPPPSTSSADLHDCLLPALSFVVTTATSSQSRGGTRWR
eukprot:13777-Eustigmatos_ZCMA.PRE.1